MEDTALMHEIRLLIDELPAVPAARVEHTLTDGYARALALEAQRSRLRRSIGELAARAAPDPVGRTRELSLLSEQLAVAEDALERLRALLSLLRARAGTAGTGVASAHA